MPSEMRVVLTSLALLLVSAAAPVAAQSRTTTPARHVVDDEIPGLRPGARRPRPARYHFGGPYEDALLGGGVTSIVVGGLSVVGALPVAILGSTCTASVLHALDCAIDPTAATVALVALVAGALGVITGALLLSQRRRIPGPAPSAGADAASSLRLALSPAPDGIRAGLAIDF